MFFPVPICNGERETKMRKVELPSIDINALTFTSNSKHMASSKLIEAFEDIGFAVVVGHGIGVERLLEMRDLLIRVFDVSDSIKENLTISRDDYRGYIPLGFFSPNEKNARTVTEPDAYEGFKLHWECPENNPVRDECALYGSNKWVKQVDKMSQIVLSYWNDCDRLASTLFRQMAMALDLEQNVFLDFFQEPLTNMTLLHYPVSVSKSRISGIHPHKDISAITILHPDPAGGLEIRTREAEWIEIFCPPEALLVNIGDLMEVWSGGRFISTPHRVFNRGQESRYSAPYFSVPRHSTLVKPLVECENSFEEREILAGEVSAEVWRTNWLDESPSESGYQLGAIN